MAERSTISQAVQIGVESTPGTPVAAPRRLGSIGVELGIQANITTRRPIGQKYANLAVLGKEWAEGDVSGSPFYTELPYLFASIFSNPTVTPVPLTGGDPSGATRWVFGTSNFDADAPRTFTIEQGDSVRAHRSSYGLLTDLSMSWSREDMEFDGTMLARRIEDGIALTPNAIMLPQVPVRPSELSVYLDTDAAQIGTSKLTRAISGEVGIGSRFTPVWVVDAAQNSFVNHVESEPEVTFSLVQQANAEGMTNLERMRSGGTAFLRLEAVGPKIAENGANDIFHRMIIDVAGQITEPNNFGDEDGVYGVEWGFGAVFSPEAGFAVRAEVITTTTAL
jgi:hypothetical protein